MTETQIFYATIGVLTSVFCYASWYMFRKDGTWNPKDFTDLNYLPTETKTPEVENPTSTTETPVMPVLEPTRPIWATVANMCAAIAVFEGGTGDLNHRNNNPGNCKFNKSGYMPFYGVVRESPTGFAIFKDWDTGMLYLNNMIKGMIHKRPNETLLQFMQRYAPTSDNNNPLEYATFIAKRLGVTIDFPVGNLG